MKSFLDVANGVYDPSRRFAFTNITAEDFASAWGGQPITVRPSQTIELPHHLAVKLTGELVDKIMIGKAKMDEVASGQAYFRSPQGTSLGVPAARKVWEDQILRELQVDEESPEIQVMRAEIKQEILTDLKNEQSIEPPKGPGSLSEFAEIKKGAPIEEKPAKRPYRVKTIKVQ